jgi:tRNA pseudouridine55 synthase
MQAKQENKVVNKNAIIIWKEVGETPLEALERFRVEKNIDSNVPMTYAGRLDPMAEGELLILSGDECKKKDQYLKLDKEYEVEIVFGIVTDTYDALGLAKISEESVDIPKLLSRETEEIIRRKIGSFNQDYPAFSSRTVNGVPMHELAKAGELPDEIPTKEVTIHSIQILELKTVLWNGLRARINENISKVKGNFRQNIILNRWNGLVAESEYAAIKIKVRCSSGTYMRSLAHEIGRNIGTGAFALAIKRTAIFI